MDEEGKNLINRQHTTYNIQQILRSFTDQSSKKEDENDAIWSSEYMKQMLFTTDERTDYLLKLRRKQNLRSLFNQTDDQNFEAIPTIVIFQRFLPGEVYNVSLTIRNVTQISRHLKVSYEPDPFFSVEFRGMSYSSVVAPGLSHIYNVQFIPNERRDYEYRLKFLTDTGMFTVPIIAIGPKAILDFPDQFQIPPTAVKILSSKTVLVRNIGDAPAIFCMYTNNSHFWIEPSKGCIETEETLQFTAYFLSDKIGDFEAKLFLEYESGEKLQINLQCSASNCTIRLDRGSVRIEETYLGMSRNKSLTIFNRSDYTVKFQWVRFKDTEIEKQQKEKYKKLFHMVYDMELTRSADLVHHNICLPDDHRLVCQRIYTDELESLANDDFRYNHSCFTLSPSEGEIWPQTSKDVTVLFNALKVGEINSTAYLEITGREDRIPLSLYGVGKGPIFRLNVITIDVGGIYLCSVHNYEIVAANRGHITGTLIYKSRPTDFGGTIKITPTSLTLKPDELKSFNLSFSSNRKGDFIERVDFIVKESHEILSLHIKGSIICPTLHFDKDSLDFGTTALGFTTRQEAYLHNLSLVPVTFSITIPNDGDELPLIYEEFAKAHVKPSFPSNPREFHVSPEEGVVAPNSSLKIKIAYTANIVRSGRTIISVEMWDSDSDPVTIPITFSGKVTTLTIKPPEITIRFSFINFPYTRSIEIENNCNLDGYFCLVPQQVSENTAIVYSASMSQGFVRACQSKTVNITIITKALGIQRTTLEMLTMGAKSPSESCVIVCNGQGPVVSTEPSSLDFGEVQVLNEKILKFSVISDSPIPAYFKATLGKKDSPWKISPTSGEIEPNGSIDLEVKLYLRDAGKYNDNVLLLIVSSRTIPVPLTANGVGCSVIFVPNIFPTLDMGLGFGQQKANRRVVMKNLGTRNYQIAWSNEPELRIQRGQTQFSTKSKFQVDPLISDVPAEETSEVLCKLRHGTNGLVEETWYVFGQIQGRGKRELIGTSVFKALITEPQILFNKKELVFRIDVHSDGIKSQRTDELLVTNRSKLDLNIELTVEPPFYLESDAEELVRKRKIVLANEATAKVVVNFSITVQSDNLYSKSYNGFLWLEYEEHSNKDKIMCRGFVNFPNLVLSPSSLLFNCELGSSAEEILTLTNNGPIPATYKFRLIEESIEMQRDVTVNHESALSLLVCSEAELKDEHICTEIPLREENSLNRQDGSGDGLINPCAPPVNSPASGERALKFKSEVRSLERNSKMAEYEVSPEEIKDFLMPIVEIYFAEDSELPALTNMSLEPTVVDYINEIMDIVPSKGTVLPYSMQHVHVGFHGFEPMKVKATAVCEIICGPTERVDILARADTIHFSVDKHVIDFGQQMFHESLKKSFTLTNHSEIAFEYKVESCMPISNRMLDQFDVNPLKVEPNAGFVEPGSFVTLDVEHRPMILGPIDLQFKLEIGHLMPLVMEVRAIGSFPQVYPCIPYKNDHERHSLELGYFAIQSLTLELFYLTKRGCSSSDANFLTETKELPEKVMEELAADGWCVISNKEIFPSSMDIEMAVERFLAKKFIDENSYALTNYNSTRKRQPIPQLFSTEYIIDMGYVIVGVATHYSMTICNYGPWTSEIRLKKMEENTLAKSGIVVQFKRTNLMIGETSILHIIWKPVQEKYTERRTNVKHTIFLEVTHGCTIPIIIKGTVTYPYITLSTKLLDFGDVLVGECSMMCVLIKNEGLVDCEWDTKLSNAQKRQKECPFYVYYDLNVIPPARSTILHVYFKPQKTYYIEGKLNVTVKMSLESQTVTLVGRGVERKLNIIEPAVRFSSVVPFTELQERTFTIENICEYPVEFFWRHLDRSFLIENRVTEALAHYYQVDEILLPRRNVGEPMPQSLTEFYNALINEMAQVLSIRELGEEGTTYLAKDNEYKIIENGEKERENIGDKTKGQNVTRMKKKSYNGSKQSRQKLIEQKTDVQREFGVHEKEDEISSDSSSSDPLNENSPPMLKISGYSDKLTILPSNPVEVHKLLHHYIDDLQKDTAFREKMKDPVGELFRNLETKSTSLNGLMDSTKAEKKVCIIFHGAPFTEYQQAACKSARALGVLVLCINKAIIETMAFSESSCSVKLRQIVDNAYEDYLIQYERHVSTFRNLGDKEGVNLETIKDAPNEKGSQTGKYSKKEKSPKAKSPRKKDRRVELDVKSSNRQAFQKEEETILQFHIEPDPLKEFDKIPKGEDLETLDPLSRYEYKVQTILLLQRILPSTSPRTVSARDKMTAKSIEKSVRKKQGTTFLDIDVDLFAEVLEERLSVEDFKPGFVVQSLENDFLNNTVETLLLLLRIVGHVEYSLFVTFLNSMSVYNTKLRKLRDISENKESQRMKRIQDIDEMSLSEYNLLSEEDKKMYVEAILPAKKEEALRRRIQFTQRLTELKKKKELRRSALGSKTSKKKRAAKLTKNKPVELSTQEGKSTNSRATSSKKGATTKVTKSRENSKHRGETVSKDMQKVIAAMDQYRADLSAIVNIIENWDPIGKIVVASPSGKNKVPKTAKSKDKSSLDISSEAETNKFHVWYVLASDPWDNTIYDMITVQMKENSLAKDALPVTVISEPDLRPKVYSILTPKDEQEQFIHTCDAYQLTAVSSILDNLSMISEEISISDVNQQKARRESKGNRRKRMQKLPSKVEDQKSLNASSIGSKDTNNMSSIETMVEEPLKPRWILQPNEIQKFRIRFKPEMVGTYEQTYALTIADGKGVTYEINVKGVADIPRLDLNPKTMFSKIEKTKMNIINKPTYFLDEEFYDFGSLLIPQKGKRIHRGEAEIKFRNISQVDAEVYFSLSGNNPGCFTMHSEKLLIAPGECEALNLSAVATKLGLLTDQLYLCIKNNPKVEIIKLRCTGTKADVEFDQKHLSFERVLLYRREFRILTIRNKCAVSFFWRIDDDEPAEPQITCSPSNGAIKALDEQKIEFCYYGIKVGVIGKKMVTFKFFLHEDDDEAILAESITMTGETYDVAVDINHANPIDLKCVKVDFPANAYFTINNRGNYEVKYAITPEKDENLPKISSSFPINLKECLKIQPVSGTVQPQKETVVQVTFIPKNEFTLKESPILKCHLLDTKKETTLVAELPLTVSLTAYYTRFRVYPYPKIDFGSLAICTQKTMYLNIENTGKFPLHYSICIQLDRHPSVIYMSQIPKENLIKKGDQVDKRIDISSKKSKKSSRTEKKAIKEDAETLKAIKVGPITVTKTEGDVDVNQTDTIAINCYPEFVGSQEEQIVVLVPDSLPEDRDGKTITLSVNSYVPSIDFQALDATFQGNHIVDHIQDFNCPKEIGAHTVFARQEKCLYFRYIKVLSAHSTCFKLYNRNVIPADVEVHFLPEFLTPKTANPDTFIVEPNKERVPPMSHKTFTVSFAPTLIQSFTGVFEAFVVLPAHLKDEKLVIKVTGESCVPQVAIVEPCKTKRERAILSFGRTLVTEENTLKFAFENIGVIQAKVIVEIHEDPNFLFSFVACSATQSLAHTLDHDENSVNSRCAVIRLMPGNVGRFEATFQPREIGKYNAQICLFIVDNPYENLVIDLEGEGYIEDIVFKGLEIINKKPIRVSENRETNRETRRTSRQNLLSSASATTMLPVSLTYSLDYGTCFVNKMYKRAFKIVNKSTDRWFRFQWSAHPDVVFVPSIGHLKYLTYKEITATFLTSEATNHTNTHIECIVCEIRVVNSSDEIAWDDRQTEVRWEEMDSIIPDHETDAEVLARKVVEPTIEPDHEVVPGTAKCIRVLLNATVAYSEYSCAISEIHFKDTLMFQTRVYTFTLSNPGIVDTTYEWKINMDEEYPKRFMENSPNLTSRPRSMEDIRSGPNSKSMKVIPSTMSELHREIAKRHVKCVDDENLKVHRFGPLPPYESIIEVKPISSSQKASDLFSSTAGLTERSTDSWIEGNELSFEIYPAEGSLSPGCSVECTIKFSPMDVFHYKAYLTCKIENLSPKLQELIIPIVARSLLPYCHFDVEESDYITSGRRDPKLPGPMGCREENSTLWENIRVIEFKVVGVGETHIKKFHLINPTADNYHFSWKDRTLRFGDEISNFHCVVPEGLVERGKRTDLAFTFLAEDVGIFESFWLFSIEKYNLESLFLFVGVVTEPSVHCLTVHVKLKPTVLGISVGDSVRIINDEDFPIPFHVLEESLHSEGKYQSLTVTPMSGTLAPKKEQTLWVQYHSTRTGEFQFFLQCAVRKMKKPFTIFINASSYDIVSSVSYTDANGRVTPVYENQENIIDFGRLMPNESRTLSFDIKNSGNMTFYYKWDLGMTPEIASKNMYSVTISERQGYVINELQSTSYLTLTVFQKLLIKNHVVELKISKGCTYRFTLKAIVKKPSVEFSFNQYDFGPCYIQENNSPAYCTTLCITNYEKTAFIIECQFEDLPHISVNLDAISEAVVPNTTINIPIMFRPIKEMKYRECLVFIINSVTERRIIITGEGITYKVRLVNSRDKSIDLGNIPVNKTVIRKVAILNDGCAPIELKFDLMKCLHGYEKYRERTQNCLPKPVVNENERDLTRASISETKRSETYDLALQTGESNLSDVLKIQPSTNVLLRPNKRINVTVKFSPTRRMRPFASKVALQTSSTILPLFIVRGSCIGAEFRLNRTYVSFGIVVQGCTSETKIILLNIGDIGARFKWNTSKLSKEFKITPTSGYSSPGMDVTFVIKFQPTELHSSIEGLASIEIEKYGSLNVKTTGGCCKLPEPTETLFFASTVRDKQTKSVTIVNDTNLTWKLRPEVTGEYFDTEELLHVLPTTSASCAVTYAPIVMNTESTPHKGTLILKLPDDKAPVTYSLHGLSLPPRVLAKIVRQFPAKTSYAESLVVYNWLDTQQRFECRTELINGHGTQSKEIPLFNFVGNSKIDVPPKAQRDYRVTFYSYKEYDFHLKVMFTNHEGEYQFYEIEYNVTRPEIIETIRLTARVRSSACYTLQLENPLKEKSISYTIQCQHPSITIQEFSRLISPQSHEYVEIKYYPLLPCDESIVMLDVNCQELGHFPYELRLKAMPALPEKVTRVNSVIGSFSKFFVPVKNCTKKNAEFKITVDNDCFACQKSIEVPALNQSVIEVTYEPCDIENVTGTLKISSITAGEFIFPIIGTYSLPKPSGPYVVTERSPVLIPFKNVFLETKVFDLILDDPETFMTETPSMSINQKKNITIKVSLRNSPRQEDKVIEEKYPVTGKLIICCTDHRLSQVNWTYYLRGIFD